MIIQDTFGIILSKQQFAISNRDSVSVFEGQNPFFTFQLSLYEGISMAEFKDGLIILSSYVPDVYKSIIVDISSGQIIEYENLVFHKMTKSFIAFNQYRGTNMVILNRTDFTEKIMISRRSGNRTLIHEDWFLTTITRVLTDNKGVFCQNLKSLDSTNWEYEIPKTYERKYYSVVKRQEDIKIPSVDKILGVYENLVWLVLNTGQFIALDLQTGHEVHSFWRATTGWNAPFDDSMGFNFLNCYSELDPDKGIIFGFRSHYYWEIDLKDPSTQFIVYDWELDAKHHNILNSASLGYYWEGDYIYFYETERSKKLGIFSRSRRSLVWSSKLEEIKGTFQKILYYQGQILILDSGSQLHFIPTEFNP
jgi:hypothetical protein